MFDALARDLRHGVRRLISRPSYSLVAIVTLALVIGAGGAVLAVVNATLVRPLPFPEPERLARIYTMPPGVAHSEVRLRNPLHSLDFVRFRERLRSADAVVALAARDRALGGDGDPESVPAAQVSAGGLALLGGAPLLGRAWTEEEDRAGARLVVLGYGLWQRRFGGRPSVIGEKVTIDREPHDVIGVMGPAFEPAYVPSEFWTPLGIHAGNLPTPAATFLATVARLRPGATAAELDAEVRALMPDIVGEGPPTHKGWSAGAIPMRAFQFGTRTPALLVLLGATLVLAAIACANLANLTLADVLSRRGEMALRAALGADRRDAVRLQAVEAVLLAAAGTAAGLPIAWVTVPALLALDPQVAVQLTGVSIDWRVQLTTATLAMAVSMAAALWPILRATSGDLAGSLAAGGRRTIGARRDRRAGQLLIVAEVALTVVLLGSSALLLGAFDRTSRVAPAFDVRGVLGGQIRLPAGGTSTPAQRAAFVQQVVERLRTVPGVIDAATTTNLFVPGFAIISLVDIEGKPSPDGQSRTVQFRRVTPGYFKAMRIRERAGRTFTDRDGLEAPPVAVISQAFADRWLPGEDPLGRRIVRSGVTLTIIGVVDDVRDVALTQAGDATLYVNYLQQNNQTAPISLVVRAAGDPLALAASVRAAVFSVDPAQPVDHILTLEQFLSDSLGPDRFRTTLLAIFAGLALLLSAVGVYGVTARSAAERSREMGVRLAMGAEPGQIWRLLVGQGMAVVAVGVVAGAAGSLLAGLALTRALAGVDAEGAVAGAALPAAAMLGIAAFIACALPARRVLRVDPVIVLRD